MARPAYSISMLEVLSEADTSYDSILIPEGYIWVVRDITIVAPPAELVSFSTNSGVVVTNHYTGVVLYRVSQPFLQNNRPYHWEGRKVMGVGEYLRVAAADNYWSVSISGYQLTLL